MQNDSVQAVSEDRPKIASFPHNAQFYKIFPDMPEKYEKRLKFRPLTLFIRSVAFMALSGLISILVFTYWASVMSYSWGLLNEEQLFHVMLTFGGGLVALILLSLLLIVPIKLLVSFLGHCSYSQACSYFNAHYHC